MAREEIQQKFEQIAAKAAIPEIGQLVRELGALMQDRMNAANDAHTAITGDIEKLRSEFQELSQLLFSRLKDTERVNGDRVQRIIDRTHNLSNRFMAVEEKVNQVVEMIDLGLGQILEKIGENGDRADDTTTANQQ